MYRVGDIVETQYGLFVILGFSKPDKNAHSRHVYYLFDKMFLECITLTYALFYPVSKMSEAFYKKYVCTATTVGFVTEKKKEHIPVEKINRFLVKSLLVNKDTPTILGDAEFRETIKSIENKVLELEDKLRKEPKNEIYRYTKVVDLEDEVYRNVVPDGTYLLDDMNILYLQNGMLYKAGELKGRTWGERYFNLLTNPLPKNFERYEDEGKHSFLLRLQIGRLFVYGYMFSIMDFD